MHLTNKFGVPEAIVIKIKADIDSDPYNKKDDIRRHFRTTELIGPPLIQTLQIKHDDIIEQDAIAYLAVQYGTQFHKLCEGFDNETYCYEQKVHKVVIYNGIEYVIDGTIDEIFFDGGCNIVTDNKTILLRNLPYPKPEYEKQLNVYAHMLRGEFASDIPMKLQIRYFIKDWTPGDLPKALERQKDDFAVMLTGNKKAKKSCATQEEAVQYIARELSPALQARASVKQRDKSYMRAQIRKDIPESSILHKPVALESAEAMNAFLQERLRDHIDTPERPCTEEERFSNDARCKYYCAARSVCLYAKSKGY